MTDSVEPYNARDRTTGELLSLIVGRTVKDVPDLSALSRMTSAEMADRLGIDRKGAQTIQAALELAHRSKTLGRNRVQFPDASAISAWFRERLGEHRKESFWALTLDQKHKVIDCHRISEGSLTMTVVHPREAFNPVLRDSAAAVIFVHNHPSGDPAPSWGDRELTHRILECGHLLGIRVLDHLVVGSEEHYSFYDHGELENGYGSRAAEIDREKPDVSVKREAAGRKSKEIPERSSEKTEFVVPKKEPARQKERFRDDGRGR
jgi:DNA repair protein RadC